MRIRKESPLSFYLPGFYEGFLTSKGTLNLRGQEAIYAQKESFAGLVKADVFKTQGMFNGRLNCRVIDTNNHHI
jgi:hypothetical protein